MNTKEYIKEAVDYADSEIEKVKQSDPEATKGIEPVVDVMRSMIIVTYVNAAIKHDCDMVEKAFNWMHANSDKIVFASNLQSLKDEFIKAMGQ